MDVAAKFQINDFHISIISRRQFCTPLSVLVAKQCRKYLSCMIKCSWIQFLFRFFEQSLSNFEATKGIRFSNPLLAQFALGCTFCSKECCECSQGHVFSIFGFQETSKNHAVGYPGEPILFLSFWLLKLSLYFACVFWSEARISQQNCVPLFCEKKILQNHFCFIDHHTAKTVRGSRLEAMEKRWRISADAGPPLGFETLILQDLSFLHRQMSALEIVALLKTAKDCLKCSYLFELWLSKTSNSSNSESDSRQRLTRKS